MIKIEEEQATPKTRQIAGNFELKSLFLAEKADIIDLFFLKNRNNEVLFYDPIL